MIKGAIQLLRPHQWIKNGMIFLPIIFGGRIFDCGSALAVLMASLCFCLVSSAVYCLNDVIDYDSDVLNPEKRNRPVAGGIVTKRGAIAEGLTIGIVGLTVGYLLLPSAAIYVLVSYLGINILYCLWLKRIMLIDVIVIATGFVLRVVIGGVAGEVELSQWIIIMIFLLALFLALSKRRYELVAFECRGKRSVRDSVSGYNKIFLDVSLSMLGAILITGYIMYTLQSGISGEEKSEYLYITALPVLYGILRYLRLTIVDNASGCPTEVVYADSGIRTTVIVWIVSVMVLIYCR